MGAVPSVAGLHSAPVPGNQPLWTPPETPLTIPGTTEMAPTRTSAAVEPPRRTHSASSSVSGIVGSGFAVRTDSDVSERPDVGSTLEGASVAATQGMKREGEDKGSAPKRRRIAPTPVSAFAESPAESVGGSMDPPSVPPSAEP